MSKLNYPIRYHYEYYPSYDGDTNTGVVYKSEQEDIVVVHSDGTISTCWDDAQVENFITTGLWIVEASGPEALKEPTSHPKDVASLTSKIDTKDVTEALDGVQKLTEALKECRRELKRFQRG